LTPSARPRADESHVGDPSEAPAQDHQRPAPPANQPQLANLLSGGPTPRNRVRHPHPPPAARAGRPPRRTGQTPSLNSARKPGPGGPAWVPDAEAAPTPGPVARPEHPVRKAWPEHAVRKPSPNTRSGSQAQTSGPEAWPEHAVRWPAPTPGAEADPEHPAPKDWSNARPELSPEVRPGSRSRSPVRRPGLGTRRESRSPTTPAPVARAGHPPRKPDRNTRPWRPGLDTRQESPTPSARPRTDESHLAARSRHLPRTHQRPDSTCQPAPTANQPRLPTSPRLPTLAPWRSGPETQARNTALGPDTGPRRTGRMPSQIRASNSAPEGRPGSPPRSRSPTPDPGVTLRHPARKPSPPPDPGGPARAPGPEAVPEHPGPAAGPSTRPGSRTRHPAPAARPGRPAPERTQLAEPTQPAKPTQPSGGRSQHERQHRRNSGVTKELRRDGHRPAGVHAVVDQQNRTAHRVQPFRQLGVDRQFLPHLRQA
jgi:hypothetical protein